MSFLCPQRLQTKVIKIVDVSYGGENGFNQAIELASDALANVKFIQEKKLIGKSVHQNVWLILSFVKLSKFVHCFVLLLKLYYVYLFFFFSQAIQEL